MWFYFYLQYILSSNFSFRLFYILLKKRFIDLSSNMLLMIFYTFLKAVIFKIVNHKILVLLMYFQGFFNYGL